MQGHLIPLKSWFFSRDPHLLQPLSEYTRRPETRFWPKSTSFRHRSWASLTREIAKTTEFAGKLVQKALAFSNQGVNNNPCGVNRVIVRIGRWRRIRAVNGGSASRKRRSVRTLRGFPTRKNTCASRDGLLVRDFPLLVETDFFDPRMSAESSGSRAQMR